jgi:PAS domain S-box-containing protein
VEILGTDRRMPLNDFGALLREKKGSIIAAWEKRTRAEISAAKVQTKSELRNSLPKFLERLAESLSAKGTIPIADEAVQAASEEHGKQRAQLGEYNLHQMLTEYRFLREAIFEGLETTAPLPKSARDIVLTAIEWGMTEAGAKFAKAVREKEVLYLDQYRLIVNNVQDHAIIRTDCDGNIREWNRGAENILGYTREEMIGKNVSAIFTPEDLAEHADKREMVTALENGKAEDKRWHVRKDGFRIYANGILNPLRDDDARILGFVKVLHDDTLRMQAEESLKDSEKHFRQLANALPLIVWTATSDFHVDWYSDWWFKYLGLPRGTSWDDPGTFPMHPADVERTRERIKEAVATGNDFFMEQRFRRGSDGQYRWHVVRGLPIRDSHGRVVKWIGANADIHDQKIAHQKLEEEREIREKFIATLSHDLRTPLTAAKMSAELIGRNSSTISANRRHSHRIVTSMERADRMIRDLLDVSRIRVGEKLSMELAECDFVEIARSTIDDLTTIHGDKFILNAPEALPVTSSGDGFRRILENLCGNAVKYGSRTDRVSVTIRSEKSEVELSVHNRGNPISDEDLAQLFEPYKRTNSAKEGKEKGWGLGLTLVRGISETLGGHVGVESSAAGGTTFRVCLPTNSRERPPEGSPPG